MSIRKPIALLVSTMLSFAASQSHAGAYIGADASGPNVVMHPSNYNGAGGNVTVRVCISPASSVTTNLEVPVQNVIFTMNQQQPTTGNLLFGGANDIPSNAFDAESALLHETGHCVGLAHPNLATESGLPASQRDFTKTTTGSNGSYDLNDGVDNVLGSQDDLRGDDINLHWFRTLNNNPFTIAGTVDSTTYSRNIGLLPGGSFVANAARAVSTLLGVPNTEASMQQGQSSDEAQRTLGHDDVATLGYGRSGVDEVAGTSDDYTMTLQYQGITSSGCDVTVSVDANTGFASCSVGFQFVGGGDHYRITTGTVRLNNATNWYYNQTPITPPDNSEPVLAPIGDQIVSENVLLNIPLSASDADSGDTLAFVEVGLPDFCVLTDLGNRTGDIDCAPGPGDSGNYAVSIFVVDDGTPVASDTETFNIEVTDDNTVPLLLCTTPALAIPDGSPAGVSDDIIVSQTGTIADLDVTLTANHTWVGDLIFALERVDSGSSAVLIDRPGEPASNFGCGDDDIDATIDDEGVDGAAEDTCNASPPALSGSLTPTTVLGVFDGESVGGTWRLTVSDNVDQDTGTLTEWCLSARVIPDPDVDSDGDSVFDSSDNCIDTPNADQRDSNGDDYGNLCDADLNDDCVTNAIDLGLLRTVFFGSDPDADFNGDGVVNAIDLGVFKALFFTPPGPSGLTTLCDVP